MNAMKEKKETPLSRTNSKKVSDQYKINTEQHSIDPNNPNNIINNEKKQELAHLEDVFNTPQKKLLKREDTSENMKITHR